MAQYDTLVLQKNAGGRWINLIISPTVDSILTFGSSKVAEVTPKSTFATPAFVTAADAAADAALLTSAVTFTNKILGTGTKITIGSDATGDVWYRHSDGTIRRLGIGTNGYVMTVSGGVPVWSAPSGGGSLAAWLYKTTTYTAVASDRIQADTAAGVWTLSLPASPASGQEVTVEDVTLSWGAHALTIAHGSGKINSATADYVANFTGGKLSCVYINNTIGWSIK